MRINTKQNKNVITTHEGAPARRITILDQLKRSVMACMLWERNFYEDGQDIADRLCDLVGKISQEKAAEVAIEARDKMYLRHVPLLIASAMAKRGGKLVGDTLEHIIQRPDELSEFLAIYWLNGKCPLSAQVKKGLAMAFRKFNEYQLAKYNRDGDIKLRDVLFMCHAKPKDREQECLWKRLIDNKLATPDTWEVSLSGGADKKETWTRLLTENKLGIMALLRNLRNMVFDSVSPTLISSKLATAKPAKVLPFRFITAAKHAPRFKTVLEQCMLKCLNDQEKLPGKTVLLVDVSYSMTDPISSKSEVTRYDAAGGLAILAREICEDIEVYSFSNDTIEVPARRGFALRDAIWASQENGCTHLGAAVKHINNTVDYDRLIVITDEQSYDVVSNPVGTGYMINVACNKHGVGYGKWIHIDGWSESIIKYIQALENNQR